MPDDGATLARIEAKLDLLLARTDRAVDPRVGAFLRAVDQAWGNGPWRAGELIAWASDPAFAGRRAVLTATEALLEHGVGDGNHCRGSGTMFCRLPVTVTAHRLGLRLVRIAGIAAAGLALERVAAREHGARLWAVNRVQGLPPRTYLCQWR